MPMLSSRRTRTLRGSSQSLLLRMADCNKLFGILILSITFHLWNQSGNKQE